MGENVTVSQLALPFGWTASPTYFQPFGTAIRELRESYGMDGVGRSGSGRFFCFYLRRRCDMGRERIRIDVNRTHRSLEMGTQPNPQRMGYQWAEC